MQILGSGEKIIPEALIPKFEINRLLKQGKNMSAQGLYSHGPGP
jgi:hypothetical protein